MLKEKLFIQTEICTKGKSINRKSMDLENIDIKMGISFEGIG